MLSLTNGSSIKSPNRPVSPGVNLYTDWMVGSFRLNADSRSAIRLRKNAISSSRVMGVSNFVYFCLVGREWRSKPTSPPSLSAGRNTGEQNLTYAQFDLCQIYNTKLTPLCGDLFMGVFSYTYPIRFNHFWTPTWLPHSCDRHPPRHLKAGSEPTLAGCA